MKEPVHPIERLQVARAIQKGQALKNVLDRKLITLVGASLAPACSGGRYATTAPAREAS